MRNRITALRIALLALVAGLVAACGGGGIGGPSESQTLRIVSGSENSTLEPIIQNWAQENNYAVIVDYQGSLDIARQLRTGSIAYDAVWPANSLWLDYGDTQNITKSSESIMRSPVAFGVKRSIADSLGWVGNEDIFMEDILEATESGRIRFMMTSATQSNSGASFYFAALSAFAGSPEVISESDLQDPTVEAQITRILGTVDRSSGSSGWLKDLFLKEYQRYDAMVNYESVLIEANQELIQSGREPLYVVYPIDGLAIADSPLAYVDRGLEGKEEIFNELQAYLLTEDVQRQLLAAGRRTGLLGMNLSGADTSVFDPDWGIDVNRVIQPIRFPNADVIAEALRLYQTAFRRPSCTIYVLDFSGSMSGQGEDQLKAAMRTLLDQNLAEQYLLQGHPGDVSGVVLFNDLVINYADLEEWTISGNEPDALREFYLKIERTQAGGGTNIFDAARIALDRMEEIRTDDCLPSIIVMSDGQDGGGGYGRLESAVNNSENDVPIFSITFGDADAAQLRPMSDLTSARVFDGRENLVEAFRSAKGYN